MSEPGAAPGPEPVPRAVARPAGGSPGWLTRIGLAIGRPRWALAIAADRRYTGRSGSDLIAMIAVLLVATQLRWLAAAAWLGGAVDAGLGLRAAMRVLTGALTVDLGALLVGALVVFALAGRRRNLGRAFDLACVAVLPIVLVQLGATVLAAVAGVALPAALSWPLALGWMGALTALAIGPARSAARPPVPPVSAERPGRWIGAAVAAVAALGAAAQVIWIAGNLDLVRPMKSGARRRRSRCRGSARAARSVTASRWTRRAARSPCSTSGRPGASRAWRRCRGSIGSRGRTPTSP